MLCYYDCHTTYGGRNFQNYLLFICSINNNLSYNILGEFAYSNNILTIQKQIIQIITTSRFRDSCRQAFKKLENLPIQSQYIFSLLLFVVKYTDLYTANEEIHSINTRHNTNYLSSNGQFDCIWRGAYFFGIKLFNHLPIDIKNLSNETKLFKYA